MKTYKLIPIGVRSRDGRLVALDAALSLPEVFPVRSFDGYEMSLDGYGQNPRLVDGWLVADFALKGIAAELVEAGTHHLSPAFHGTDWEIFEETDTAVMVKGDLTGVVVTPNSENAWS